jgi:hypothetical protein
MSFEWMVGQCLFIVVGLLGWVAYTYFTHDRAKGQKIRPGGGSRP